MSSLDSSSVLGLPRCRRSRKSIDSSVRRNMSIFGDDLRVNRFNGGLVLVGSLFGTSDLGENGHDEVERF